MLYCSALVVRSEVFGFAIPWTTWGKQRRAPASHSSDQTMSTAKKRSASHRISWPHLPASGPLALWHTPLPSGDLSVARTDR